jgi:peroxiredoxin
MSLGQALDAHRREFVRAAQPDRVALYEAKIAELQAEFAQRRMLRAGDLAPEFELLDLNGRPVSLVCALETGPAVVAFYRGGWCPYCNIQLAAYQRALPQIAALGARLIALSPQSPDSTLSTAEKNDLSFAVLSDTGNAAARAFGPVYSLPPALRHALESVGKALPSFNGDESWELPVPATFVIAPDRRIVLAHIEVDYRNRLEPESILGALKALPRAAVNLHEV